MSGQTAPHLAWFGLERDPFPVVPDVHHFFLPRRLEALLAELLHAIHTRKGFIALTGEVGLGKSTLSRLVLERLEHQPVETALLLNTFVQGPALLREIVRDFGLEPAEDTHTNLERLNAFLLERYRDGRNCVIVVDDAQNLTDESLELIRLISNLETSDAKLVQILLVGQPELMDTLARPELRQLRSRIVFHARAEPLSREELEQYVAFKLNKAGHSGSLQLTRRAAAIAHQATGGVPRRVNIFMDRCLHGLFADGGHRITARLAREVARDLADQEPDHHRRPRHATPGRRAAIAGGVAAGLGLVVLVAGTLLAGAWTPSQLQTLNPWAAVASDSSERSSLALEAREAQQTVNHALDRDPLEAFLTEQGLEEHLGSVRRALSERRLEPVARRVAEETGVHLLRMQEPPRDAVAALDLAGLDGPPGWLVAWEPVERIEALDASADREAVRRLQLQLAHLGHYRRGVDGIPGPATEEAVRRFQRQHGLPERDRLDARTQFLIEQESGLSTARP